VSATKLAVTDKCRWPGGDDLNGDLVALKLGTARITLGNYRLQITGDMDDKERSTWPDARQVQRDQKMLLKEAATEAA